METKDDVDDVLWDLRLLYGGYHCGPLELAQAIGQGPETNGVEHNAVENIQLAVLGNSIGNQSSNTTGNILEDTPDAQAKGNQNSPSEQKKEKPFKSLVPFCIVFGIGSMVSHSVTVYLSSQITVIERAFGLSSTKSGMLLSANDVGFVASVLFASHFLKNRHIPRILALCVLTFGVSGILTSLPHFVFGENVDTHHNMVKNRPSGYDQLCTQTNASTESTSETCSTTDNETYDSKKSHTDLWVMVLIGTMMFIQGIAKAPRSPLSSLYLDNNSKKEKAGFYIGLLMSFSIFGPFIAILVGGLFNKIPVDLTDTSINQRDPRWVGAWWLGFVVFGACAVVVSVPIFFFPPSLRNSESGNQRVDSVVNDVPEIQHTIKDLPVSIYRVISRPVYLFHLLSTLCVMLAILTFASFGPKYIENQFQITTSEANIVIGIEKLLTTVIGTVAGGVITRRYRLGLAGSVKMILVCRSIVLFCQCFNFIFGCDNPDIIGFDRDTTKVSSYITENQNRSCDCSDTAYQPVCGSGENFFSPCHAGCETVLDHIYYNCSETTSGTAYPGICETGCGYLLPYILLNAFTFMVATLTLSPGHITFLRSVKEKDKSMAIGLMSFLMSLTVFLPAPILYGEVFDSFCIHWNKTCDKFGSCALYDISVMRVRLVAINVGLLTAGLVFTSISFHFARKVKDEIEDIKMEVIVSSPPSTSAAKPEA